MTSTAPAARAVRRADGPCDPEISRVRRLGTGTVDQRNAAGASGCHLRHVASRSSYDATTGKLLPLVDRVLDFARAGLARLTAAGPPALDR